jgi:alkaline phosphatase D
MKKVFAAFVFVAFSALSFAQSTDKPYVILVSLDGFRYDYVQRFNLPNFKEFIRGGAAAEALIPSFPSKTFPNHYTLVTGLYPGHHGLVDNSFFDPERKSPYGMRIKEAVTNPAFYGGTPLWKLAHDQGVKSASYFWVGSELKEEGLHPDYFLTYDESIPFRKRVDQVIEWLSLPEDQRPHMITLYFSEPDHTSHEFGPLAEETKQKVLAMDSLLGDLTHRVAATKLKANIIVVSDHGMMELQGEENTFIFLGELIRNNTNGIKVSNGGTQAHFYTRNQAQHDSLYTALRAKASGFTIIQRTDFPERWHYDNPRSGDILMIAAPGKYIETNDRASMKKMEPRKAFGAHGFDPDEVTDMRGIFYAMGPNIKSGSKIPAFRNIHVYPLVARILGLTLPPIDGEFSVLKGVYKK